jgi:NADH dehydrogenase FAD-containing subunit
MLAALRLSGKARGAEITLVNASDQFVERIRLHQRGTGQTLKQRPIAGLLRGTDVRFVRGRVTNLDLQAREVSIDALPEPLAYDTLVYALGSRTDLDNVPGASDHAIPIESPQFKEKLAQLALTKGRLLVVGGGLTGIEAATEIAETYPNIGVTLVTRGTLGSGLSDKGRRYVHQTFGTLGIAIREHTTVAKVDADHITIGAGEAIGFDVCLWTGSFVAAPLAREAGLAVNSRGQILVDPYLRSMSHPEVYAVGDAGIPAENIGVPIRMACATAMPMAAHAVDNIAAQLKGRKLTPYTFAYFFQCISLGRQNGLIQLVYADDSPRDRIFTGRFGAWFKEMICKYTTIGLKYERLFPGIYPSGTMLAKFGTPARRKAPNPAGSAAAHNAR